MKKLVAVTGGAQGIGRAIAFCFAQAGYAVSVADTDEEAGTEALEKVKALGAEACLFLSESAGFMTGQNIIIDGGMTKKMIYEE